MGKLPPGLSIVVYLSVMMPVYFSVGLSICLYLSGRPLVCLYQPVSLSVCACLVVWSTVFVGLSGVHFYA